MSLTNKTLADSYKDILQLDNSNNGVQAAAKTIKDGDGTESSLSMAELPLGLKVPAMIFSSGCGAWTP